MLSRRLWGIAVACVLLGLVNGHLWADVAIETPGRVETLPSPPGPHWAWVADGLLERTALVDLEQGKVAWTYENPVRKFPYLSSAATDGKLVVVGGRDKQLHTIDAATGEAVWTRSIGAKVDSSPVIVGKRVFVGAASGEILAFGLESGDPLWSFDTGSPVTASPGVSAGKLLIGTAEGQLFCFGAKPPAAEETR